MTASKDREAHFGLNYRQVTNFAKLAIILTRRIVLVVKLESH